MTSRSKLLGKCSQDRLRSNDFFEFIMLKPLPFLLLLLFNIVVSHADSSHNIDITQECDMVKIGLFYGLGINKAVITPRSSAYWLEIDQSEEYNIPKNSEIKVEQIGKKFKLQVNGLIIEPVSVFKLLTQEKKGSFDLNVNINNRWEQRSYAKDLLAKINTQSQIQFINQVDINSYLCGVISAEVGNSSTFTLYETKSYLCRTFLYAQFDRHAEEGFNLCDGVHCQAYKGLQDNAIIREVVSKSQDAVITNQALRVITPTYSANCGGETCNSEDVWITKDPHLRSVKCSHCKESRGATWTASFSLKEWKNYLKKYNITETNPQRYAFNPHGRRKYYRVGKSRIPLTMMRKDLGLRSTMFSVTVQQGNVILKGLGYGHGVGLCQEGAMQMAKQGYSAKEIISFYYKDIAFVPTSQAQPPQNIMFRNTTALSEIFNPWKIPTQN